MCVCLQEVLRNWYAKKSEIISNCDALVQNAFQCRDAFVNGKTSSFFMHVHDCYFKDGQPLILSDTFELNSSDIQSHVVSFLSMEFCQNLRTSLISLGHSWCFLILPVAVNAFMIHRTIAMSFSYLQLNADSIKLIDQYAFFKFSQLTKPLMDCC